MKSRAIFAMILFISVVSGMALGQDLTLKVTSGWIHPTLTYDPKKDLCGLPDAVYSYNKTLFSIAHDLKGRCRLNNFYNCNTVNLTDNRQQFLCGEQYVGLDGIPINESSRHRDLTILRFSSNEEIDYCKRAYDEGIHEQNFVLNGNEVKLKTRTNTDSFVRECQIKGDVITDHFTQICAKLYFTRLGVVCMTGSDSQFLRFSKLVSAVDLAEAVVNLHRPENYNFSLSCKENSYNTKWTSETGPSLTEQVNVSPKGYIREVFSQYGEIKTVHRFDRDGRYLEVQNLDRLVERPKPMQTTIEAYVPALSRRNKSSKGFFWLNYLGSLQQCCNDSTCKASLQQPDFLTNRIPSFIGQSGNQAVGQ